MLGQHSEHDRLPAGRAELRAVAAVVLVDLQLAQAHGCPAELTLNGALRAFLGLMKLQQVLLHALLAHRTPDLLVPVLLVLVHLPLEHGLPAVGAEGQEQHAVSLMEGQVGRGQIGRAHV